MMGFEIEQFLTLIAFPMMAILSSFALNLGAEKLFPDQSTLSHWLLNVAAIPTLIVAFGLYAFLSYDPVDCSPVDGMAFWCPDPDWEKLEIAFVWVLFLPLIYVCFAIPITMWFTSRKFGRR